MIPSSVLAALLGQQFEMPDSWMQSLPQAGPGGPMMEFGSGPPVANTPVLQGREHLAPAEPIDDTPEWLQGLLEDQSAQASRVLPPYGGWGGGAMQARRRGLR